MELWWVMYRCLKQFIPHKVSIPQNNERKEYMSMEEKKNQMIVEMVEKLSKMDSNSLTIMKASVDILAAKERLDKEEVKTA